MRHKKNKKIISSSFAFEKKNLSRIVRKNNHNKKNILVEYLKMLFF